MPINLGALVGGVARGYSAYEGGKQKGRERKLDEQIAAADLESAMIEAKRKAEAEAVRQRQADERLANQTRALDMAQDKFDRNDPTEQLEFYRQKREIDTAARRQQLSDAADFRNANPSAAALEARRELALRDSQANNAVDSNITHITSTPPPGVDRATWNVQNPQFQQLVRDLTLARNPELSREEVDAALARKFGRAPGPRSPNPNAPNLNFNLGPEVDF